ncbi:MAG: IPT/TIG domain-containing protein [Verrucomicrobiota bacterium]
MNRTAFCLSRKRTNLGWDQVGWYWLLGSFWLAALAVPKGLAYAGTLSLAVNQAPNITDFTPKSGPVGTDVVLTGQNLEAATAVSFNGVAAAFRVVLSESSLIATVPLGAVSGNITVTTPAGSAATGSSFTVTASPAPEILSFSPATGPVGTRVLIDGRNFLGVTEVRFHGTPAEFTLLGDLLTASVPAGATSGQIMVVAAGGSVASATSFIVTVPGAPVIASFDPAEGLPDTSVTISGENLQDATAVRFNGVAAAFSVFGNFIFATVPSGATPGPITVVTPKGTATSSTSFLALNPQAPQVTSFTPDTGGPGTVISVSGLNLLTATDVRIGGAPASFTVVSNSELKVTVPDGATTGPLRVITTSGSAESATDFFVAAQILSFQPDHGAPGTVVTVQGVNFTGAIAVLFGGTEAQFTLASPTQIRATVPAGAVSGRISIATPAGFAMSSGSFFLPPRVSSFNPPSGPETTQVTVVGDNLLGATSVRLGNADVPFVALSPTVVVATIPAGAVSGPITVTTPGGAATSDDSYYVGLFGDLGVSLIALPDRVAVGDFLQYTITVTNRGPLEASSTVLTDRLPAGTVLLLSPPDCIEVNNVVTCQLGTVPGGSAVSIRLSVVIAAGTSFTNLVEVTSGRADPRLTDNSLSYVTPNAATPPPDVSLTATRLDNAVQFSWPATADGYQLEVAPTLSPNPPWTAVGTAPTIVSGKKTVTVIISGISGFYRLRKP